MGEARLSLEGRRRVTPVVFGPSGVSPLLGAVTLQEFRLIADSVNERLVPMPPIRRPPHLTPTTPRPLHSARPHLMSPKLVPHRRQQSPRKGLLLPRPEPRLQRQRNHRHRHRQRHRLLHSPTFPHPSPPHTTATPPTQRPPLAPPPVKSSSHDRTTLPCRQMPATCAKFRPNSSLGPAATRSPPRTPPSTHTPPRYAPSSHSAPPPPSPHTHVPGPPLEPAP